MKSSPDIFLEAARRLGLAPCACLVIEDAVSGVAAAKAAGAAAWGLPPRSGPPSLPQPVPTGPRRPWPKRHTMFSAGRGRG